ncbi:alpha/beta hydrolase [Caulobacter sp. KR2-114]|uniref:alpha/beta hydrolase n=1 Tax=Caulobacter sp. KR2-114 TaxID=3400912 RepID=UPI003C1183B9
MDIKSDLKSTLAARADEYHRLGLAGVRAAIRAAIAGRDRRCPPLDEVRELVIDGPAGPLPGRLYRPRGAPPGGPALLFIHGGGFVIGDLDTNDAFCRRLADGAQVTVIAATYRLAPEARYPAQRDDALAAARWVLTHAAELGVRPDGLVLSGDSAGGYLAITLTAALNAERPGTVAAQVLVYPLMHIDDAIWSTTIFQDSRIVGRAAVAYIRSQLADGEVSAPSLFDVDMPPAPPTLIVTGGPLDPVRPDARRYGEIIAAQGARVVTREFPLLPHGWANMTHASANARKAVTETAALAGALIRGQGMGV